MFFGLLDAKPCRTMMKLLQKVILKPETCEIEPKVCFLASGFWSPEAGGTLRRQLGEPWRAAASKGLLRSCIRTL